MTKLKLTIDFLGPESCWFEKWPSLIKADKEVKLVASILSVRLSDVTREAFLSELLNPNAGGGLIGQY